MHQRRRRRVRQKLTCGVRTIGKLEELDVFILVYAIRCTCSIIGNLNHTTSLHFKTVIGVFSRIDYSINAAPTVDLVVGGVAGNRVIARTGNDVIDQRTSVAIIFKGIVYIAPGVNFSLRLRRRGSIEIGKLRG